MKKLPKLPTIRFFWFISMICACFSSGPVSAGDYAKTTALFRNPPREYSTGPLWVWNDMLSDDQIRDTLRDLARQKVKQVWVHPRPGLMTPYLSGEWFRLWKLALREAVQLDMNVWIYDENSYPSGFAGGWVPELMPESRGRGLAFREVKVAPKWADNTLGVFRLDEGAVKNVTAQVKASEVLPDARYLVVTEARAENSPWTGNRSYVNLLSPGVTEKFLEVTMEPYRREIGEHFGYRVPGVFTDEPNIRPAGDLPWSEILLREFQKRWGYELLDHLPSLRQPVGEWRKIRHNYFQLLNEQFIEYWAKPNYEYCKSNRLEWTGHYWDHEWPDCVGVPDNMAMNAWHHRPSIDCLFNQYSEHNHAQFGNVRIVRELSSVANQMGAKRTLCEIYGGAGWDLRFEDMKRIGDWLEVLGINTLNQHLTHITIRGARKRDYPQSFSYHEPWWEAYHVSADYFARLSAALCQGEQVNRILVLQPTTTVWMYQGDRAKLREVGDPFFNLLMKLESAQVEYDIGSEDILARHGSITLSAAPPPSSEKAAAGAGSLPPKAELQVGKRSYTHIVIPPFTENLNAQTLKLLQQFLAAEGGGQVLCLGQPPTRIDGGLSEEGTKLAANPNWKKTEMDELVGLLAQPAISGPFAIRRVAGDKGILFHHRRQLGYGQLLFLVNTSIDAPSVGTVHSEMRSAEQWDLYTGGTSDYPFVKKGDGMDISFQLPPSGSLLLFLSPKRSKPAPPPMETVSTILPGRAPEIARLEPNVLTLDYVDITAGRETATNLHTYAANQFAWKKNGMDRNPWDSAVQFKNELISKEFPETSGFEAAYKFRIDKGIPRRLAIVIERPDLYTITCNGQPVRARLGEWWLDKAFGRIDLSSAARVGENVVLLKATPFTMFHELEAAYLLGDFALEPIKSGFLVVPDRPLQLGQDRKVVVHGNSPEQTMWLSAGIGLERDGNRSDDRAPFVVFDLGRNVDVSAIKIWNYNEGTRDLTSRGVSKLRISGAAKDDGTYDQSFGSFDLARATGGETQAEVFPVKARGVRYVRFDILANHNGVTYPAVGEPPDQGFAGLSEVQFFDSAGQRIEDVKVPSASSELAPFQRVARHLVDGSGLRQSQEGWNRQGHPFYGGGVAYREKFEVKRKNGRFLVNLPNWYGSVAKVTVNGETAGYIDAPPWDCDVTKWIRRGENDVEVTVIGTLKNTLGPHHGNPPLGFAAPGSFHGRSPGPPPGASYSTVAYGLFEPFVLKQVTR